MSCITLAVGMFPANMGLPLLSVKAATQLGSKQYSMENPGEFDQGLSFKSLPKSQSQMHSCACPTCGNRSAPNDIKAAKATTAQTELLENMALLFSSNCAYLENNFPNDRLVTNR